MEQWIDPNIQAPTLGEKVYLRDMAYGFEYEAPATVEADSYDFGVVALPRYPFIFWRPIKPREE